LRSQPVVIVIIIIIIFINCSLVVTRWQWSFYIKLNYTKLHGLSSRANYTDRAATAGRRS
jgi:hypothetical protein